MVPPRICASWLSKTLSPRPRVVPRQAYSITSVSSRSSSSSSSGGGGGGVSSTVTLHWGEMVRPTERVRPTLAQAPHSHSHRVNR